MPIENDHAAAAPWSYRLLRWTGWAVLITVVLLVFVFPVIFTVAIQTGSSGIRLGVWMRTVWNLQTLVLQGLVIAWMFVLGSCLASFLNLVAWRLPRGKPITGASHCPSCNVRLGFRDNLPVLGWLRNGGRCRQCGSPITVRYLIAELVLGFVFLAVGTYALETGGANWPLRPIARPAGLEHLLFGLDWDFLSILSWHLALACFLFTFALIASERRAVPRGLWNALLVVGLAVPYLAPHLMLVPWDDVYGHSLGFACCHATDWIVTAVAGAIAGVIVAGIVAFADDSTTCPAPCWPTSPLVASTVSVGVFLGWQAALMVGFLALVGLLVRHVFRLRNEPYMTCTAVVFAATVAQLLLWRAVYTAFAVS